MVEPPQKVARWFEKKEKEEEEETEKKKTKRKGSEGKVRE